MLLLSEFLFRSDFQVELDGPLFVAAGDRVAYQGDGVVVTRSGGERFEHPIRDSHWICR
ncbi:hypothetical protein [Streptomyces sp. TLI_171]|uniref:hypothetical protein n=1 Tax=Streptomyces sp. TLI_171 TaxID=1938859 RepID=UPI000C3AF70E|nr:hypothetical protein [Streptomyces sp. TLI_171]